MAESSEPLQVEDDPKEEQHSEGNLFSKVVGEQGTTVISEGLGGLGMEMSKWMIDEIDTDSSQFPDWISLQRLTQDHQTSVTTKQVDVTNFDPLIDTLR